MVTKKPVNWFFTESGRDFSFALVCATGVGLTCARFLPNTIFLDKYTDLVHGYRSGNKVPLNDEVLNRFNKCLDILNVSKTHRKVLHPFTVFGLDLFNAGCCSSKYGAAIGIPINFTYKSSADIDKENLKVNLQNIDWSSEAGQLLADGLILPENVQIFAICREILTTQTFQVYLDAFYPAISITIAFTMSQFLNARMRLFEAPRAVRVVLYGLVCLFCTGLYFLMKDVTQVQYEVSVDKKLAQLGPEMIESGVQFYEKILHRNMGLRELMGSEGVNKYSKLGNENYLLRQPRIALSHRKMFFESQLNEHKGKQDGGEQFEDE